jgi:hypothetical protein
MRTDHLILGLIFFFFRKAIIHSEMATRQDTCQVSTSVLAKPDAVISLHSLCRSLSVNVYLQCALHLMMEDKVSCLSRSKTFGWYSCFKSEDNPCPGRLSTSHTEETVARVREIICTD